MSWAPLHGALKAGDPEHVPRFPRPSAGPNNRTRSNTIFLITLDMFINCSLFANHNLRPLHSFVKKCTT